MKQHTRAVFSQTTKAALGLLFAFLIPLAVILAFFLSEINERIHFSEKERNGLKIHQEASQLLESLLKQRLFTSYNLALGTSLQQVELEHKTRQQIHALSVAVEQEKEMPGLTGIWEGFWHNWQNVRQQEGSQLLDHSGQTVLIRELQHLIAEVGDSSNLILDPELDTYYLINGLINVLPLLADKRTEVMEHGLQIAASGRALISEASHLNVDLQQVLPQYSQLWRSLDQAVRARPALKGELSSLVQRNRQAQQLLQQRLETDLLGGEVLIQPAALHQMEIQAMDLEFQLSRLLAFQLDRLLQARIGVMEQRRSLAILLAGVMVLFSGLVFRGFLSTMRRQQGLEANARLISTVFSTSGEAFFIADSKQRITGINPAFQDITGYALTDVLNQPALMLAERAYDNEVYQQLLGALHNQGQWKGEVFFRRKGGQVYPTLLSITVLTDHRGTLAGFVGSFSDLSEKKEFQQSLLHLVHHDVLTGLPNRSLFEDRLQHAMAQQRRNNGMLAVLFLNLDHFKQINEGFGHATGDRILQDVAVRLRETLCPEATVARQGGDEFMVLLPEVPSMEGAGEVAQQILQALARPFNIEGFEFALPGSIGISVFPGDGEDVKTLLKNADSAVSRAKAQGRNTYGYYTAEMNQVTLENLKLENELRHAIARNELVLFYQPQIDLPTGQVMGVEALLRWKHPQMGMVSPARFIPVAEETGLILPIGEWVLREACAQGIRWQKAGFPALKMSVNLSALQFRKQDVVRLVESALQDTGLAPHLLDLEFTESLVMENTEHTIRVLENLKKVGVKLSVDDFGTGYSSLSYLKRFPVDTIKIDRSFVQSVHHVAQDAVLTRAIIALARSMNLRTVAEGVETIEQLNFLMEHSCDEVQGFYFSRPLPVEDLEALLLRQTHFEMKRPALGDWT